MKMSCDAQKHYRPKRFRSLLIFIGLTVFLTAGGLARTAETDPIRIGATVSLKGKYTPMSTMVRDSYRLWQTQINQRGGLLGRPVELILYDDRSDPERARTLYEKLIVEDKVDLVFSPYGTPLTLAASEVTERHGYVMLACAASGEQIWSRGYRYVFGVYAPAKRYLIGLLNIMAGHDLRSLAILYENSAFNTSAASGAREWANRFGLEAVLFASYPPGGQNLPDLLDRAAQLNAEGLILCAYPQDTYALLDLLAAGTYRPGVLGSTIAPALPEFYERAGKMAEGVFGPSQWEPDERIPFPGTKKFIEDFTRFAGRLPSYHAGAAYAGCQIMENAVRNCRCLDHQKIREYILPLDTVTVIGRFKVDHQGMQIGHNSIIIQWQDGEKEIVFPTNMQTSPPRIPRENSKTP